MSTWYDKDKTDELLAAKADSDDVLSPSDLTDGTVKALKLVSADDSANLLTSYAADGTTQKLVVGADGSVGTVGNVNAQYGQVAGATFTNATSTFTVNSSGGITAHGLTSTDGITAATLTVTGTTDFTDGISALHDKSSVAVAEVNVYGSLDTDSGFGHFNYINEAGSASTPLAMSYVGSNSATAAPLLEDNGNLWLDTTDANPVLKYSASGSWVEVALGGGSTDASDLDSGTVGAALLPSTVPVVLVESDDEYPSIPAGATGPVIYIGSDTPPEGAVWIAPDGS